MKKMYEVTTEERMLKFHVQEYERCARYIMPACSIVAGRHIDQTFAIIDLKGARRLHMGLCSLWPRGKQPFNCYRSLLLLLHA